MADLISTEDYMKLPHVPPDASYSYGQDANQYVDLYLPRAAGPYPVVVMLHGGCWGARYGAKPLGELCRALNEVGFAVWNVDYRRNGNGGSFPDFLLDVAHATDLLRRAADEHPLDLTRVLSMGHSAGGQLACWVAARRRLYPTSPVFTPNPLPIHGVVALAGIIDLVAAVPQRQCQADLVPIMGGTPEQVPERYAQASPMALLPLGVKQIHIVGDQDTEILENVQPYITEAKQLGDDVRLVVARNAGHFELVVPTTPAWKFVRDAALSLK
jgi:acetyl esterase/lipase